MSLRLAPHFGTLCERLTVMDHIAPPGTRNPGFRSKLSALLRTLKIAFVAGIAQSAVMGCTSTPNVDNSVVPEFDLVRFLGKWHEIARFDHPFERGIEEAEATYSLLPNGKVQVLNSGRKGNETRIANGIAKTTGTPGLLRVTFFWPFYADYRVMSIDGQYSRALVGSDSGNYLWILSRTPRLNETDKRSLLDEAKRRGYNIEKLIWLNQSRSDLD